MNDELGARIKGHYEDRTRFLLPRRTFTVIRVDGKAFHTFTRGCQKPFDHKLMEVMDETAIFMASNIQGCVLAYTQSDEISLVLTDFTSPQTDAWFDGNVQKIASIASSLATAGFNNVGWDVFSSKLALFDARVFTIPDRIEVKNYLIWRQADATRNSIQMAAQSVYSQKELHGKNVNELQEMLFQKGINWNNYTSGEKRGRAIVKETYSFVSTAFSEDPKTVLRKRWVSLNGTIRVDRLNNETPIFSKDTEFLEKLLPKLG